MKKYLDPKHFSIGNPLKEISCISIENTVYNTVLQYEKIEKKDDTVPGSWFQDFSVRTPAACPVWLGARPEYNVVYPESEFF